MGLQTLTDGVPEMKQPVVHCLCLSSGLIFVTDESNERCPQDSGIAFSFISCGFYEGFIRLLLY